MFIQYVVIVVVDVVFLLTILVDVSVLPEKSIITRASRIRNCKNSILNCSCSADQLYLLINILTILE